MIPKLSQLVGDHMQQESCEHDIYIKRYAQSTMDVHGSNIVRQNDHTYFIS